MQNLRSEEYYAAQARLGKRFLHPGGSSATEALLRRLPPLTSDALVVELGCGLGSTADLILRRQPCRYIGIDASSEMLRRAGRLLRRYGDRVTFIRHDLGEKRLPLESDAADALLAESVVGVTSSRPVLQECRRVLKSGSTLLLNERIWGESVSADERERLDLMAERLYGHRLAAEGLETITAWESYLASVGFSIQHTELIDGRNAGGSRGSFTGKLVAVWHTLAHPMTLPVLLRDRRIARQYAEYWKRMENWFIVARKE